MFFTSIWPWIRGACSASRFQQSPAICAERSFPNRQFGRWLRCLLFLHLASCASPRLPAGDITLEMVEGQASHQGARTPPTAHWRWVDGGTHAERVGAPGERIDPYTLQRSPVPRDPISEQAQILAPSLGFSVERAEQMLHAPVDRSENGERYLLTEDGDLYLFTPSEAQLLRITETPSAEYGGDLSPDGLSVAYLRDYNLFLRDLSAAQLPERALSSDGSRELLYGRLDWVYQEEIYGRGRFAATWWSPDGAYLAFLRLDDRQVPVHTLIDERELSQKLESVRYPQSGEPNPIASLWVAPRGGEASAIDLARYGTDALIAHIAWLPAGSELSVQVQDRSQTNLALLRVALPAGTVTEILREESRTWVDVHGAPHWLAGGFFLWQSERSGHRHVYLYSRDGTLIRALTAGTWEVFEILAVDVERSELWFSANREHPLERHAYRVSLAGGEPVRLTSIAGSHVIEVSHDRAFFLDRHSSVDRRPAVDLCDRDGRVIATLAESGTESPFERQPTRLVEIPASDGTILHGLLVLPQAADAGARCPLLIDTYAGPETASVENEWQGSAWLQFLAQNGVAALRLNCRTTSLCGQAGANYCYRQLGVWELRDHEDAVHWAKAQPWSDVSRVGISGHSYGGFMAAYALTHSNLFALGIAESGVYDWRHYDSIYTERFMQTPAQNPGGYRRSSCIDAAQNLSGHLVLIHGTMDDNVHLQNTIRFCNELVRHEKTNFELMLYPGTGHSYRDPHQLLHRRRLHWAAIRRYLLRDGGEE